MGLHSPGDNASVIRMPVSTWSVEFHPGCEAWADGLDQADSEALLAAINVLRSEGPGLGRPLVDTLQHSDHRNMKELLPGSTAVQRYEFSLPSI
jgi:hypothetical protein